MLIVIMPVDFVGMPRMGRNARKRSLRCSASLVEQVLHKTTEDVGPSVLDHIAATLTTMMVLSDVDAAVADPSVVADAAAETTKKSGGFLSFFADGFESFLKLIDAGLSKAGVPFSYGFSIIVLTLLVKIATYPLSKKQVESTLSMQQLQPKVKELQAKYANDAERLQMETAKLYQTSGVNPLAGCLPTLVTIPVFIGLYRALGNVADEGLLTEGFFWIPSLAGPTKLNGGLGWLVPVDGQPPLGWHDTIAYLVMPVLLIISQYASQKIISPPQSQDPAQAQTQNILKFIPLMIGYFSLNVPSGLTLYWFTNNLVTTAQQVWLRRQFDVSQEATAAASTTISGGTYVAPKVDEGPKKPSGKDLNARRSSKVVDVEAVDVTPSPSKPAQSSRGEKFRAIKAREAAKKAAAKAVTPEEPAPEDQNTEKKNINEQDVTEETVAHEGTGAEEKAAVEVTASASSSPQGKKKSGSKKGKKKN